jgi:CheY-like chemotaxis protein
MRLRFLKRPDRPIDGFLLERFQTGLIYDVGAQLAGVLLAEGWAEPTSDPVSEFAAPARRTAHGVVLVIDDDPALRDCIAALLRSHGYTVVLAEHGKDGLERLHEKRPDVILLDLNMPVMDGWAFRAEQRRLADERLASVPVLLCTATLDGEEHAAELQVAALIEKPVDMDRLLDAVHSTVQRSAF